MFTVKECTENARACEQCNGASCALCSRYGGKMQEGDRIFVLTDDTPRGVGVLGLHKGKVVLKGIFGDLDAAYRDILLRSLLHVCRCMQPITVRAEGNDARLRAFGFAPADGGMECENTKLNFH